MYITGQQAALTATGRSGCAHAAGNAVDQRWSTLTLLQRDMHIWRELSCKSIDDLLLAGKVSSFTLLLDLSTYMHRFTIFLALQGPGQLAEPFGHAWAGTMMHPVVTGRSATQTILGQSVKLHCHQASPS